MIKKYISIGLLALTLSLVSATGALAISFNLSTGTDDSSSLTYTAGGVTLTLNNAVDTSGNAANFGITSEAGIFFSNTVPGATVYDGSPNIDTFDITFSHDVTISSFTRGYDLIPSSTSESPDPSMSFTISRGNASSGTVNIGGSTGTTVDYGTSEGGLQIAFDQGGIPYFAANQAYTVDFTRGAEARFLSLYSLDLDRYRAPAPESIIQIIQVPRSPSVIPEPGTMTLLSLGLIGLAGYRRRETNT